GPDATGNTGVVPIPQVPASIREVVFEWRNSRAADLLFTHRTDAIIVAVILIGLSIAVLVGRALTRSKAGRTQVALPAVLEWSGGSWTSIIRHGALLLFPGRLPVFVLALAHPFPSLTPAGRVVPRPPHRADDRRLVEHDGALSGRTPQLEGAERSDVLHHGGRGGGVHPPAAERQVSRPHRPDRIRRRSVRGDAVHHRLRQHP